MSEFKPLPFDYERCDPRPYTEEICKTCERWASHPQQTFGERTSINQYLPGKPGCHKEKK